MPKTVHLISEAYTFDELSDAAKEVARQWYRETRYTDADDFDSVIKDFVTVAEIIGIEFDNRTVNTVGGKSYQEPKIWWSGFCSQGDGACFEGDYDYKATAPMKIREHYNDAELHRIADELSVIQLRNRFGLHARMTHRGSYYHAHSMEIDVHDRRDEDRTIDDADAITELMRDLANWLYKQLDDENDYLDSAECIDEAIRANEYMFDEEGNRHDFA